MTFKEATDLYWKYYISLEDQFVETRRYVEFDYINNAKAYSIEFLKLFQAVCSEVDVVGKELASLTSNSFKPTRQTGIYEWWFYLTEKNGSLVNRTCSLFGEYNLQPWKNYVVVRNPKEGSKKYILDKNRSPRSKTPSWWNDYNSVKHNRTGEFEKHSTNYAKANLRNMFLAFSALYSLEVELMKTVSANKDECVPTSLESRLFEESLPFYTVLLRVV